MKKQILLVSILTTLGFSRASANDVTAVNWGGNYVGSTQTFSDLTGFSTTIPLMNTGASYSGTSPTFYGGGHTENCTFNYFTLPYDTGITDEGGNDAITFSWPGNSTTSAFGEVLWQKADFLNGASATGVAFDPNSSLSYSLALAGAVARFIVQDGSTYYVSNLNFGSSTTLTDPDNSTTWATYLPTEPPSSLPFDASGATFSPHTFTDIQAVGYYFDSENNFNTTYDYGVNGFSAQVQPTPEPSPFVLLALSLFVVANSRMVGRSRAQAFPARG